METSRLKLVTIVAESVVEARLLEELRALGARGYSLSEVSGEGSRGIRASEWGGKNVKIETIVTPAVAERIFGHLAGSYFAHYAVIAWAADVEVVRGDKYV